jgi:hypothetical protein
METRVPLAAMLLGLAGLLPPLVGAVVAWGDLGSFGPVAGGFILVYAALIFSFLGGSWWAFACTEERPRPWLLGLAVLPSVLAWLVMPALGTVKAGLTIAGLILLSPAVDWLLQRRGLTPEWWLRLRIPLSFALAVLVALSVWWGR